MSQTVKKISVVKRQDPLDDFMTLSRIGRAASRLARAKALKQGVGYTYGKSGRIIKRNPDGSEQLIRVMKDAESFPSLQADLCQG